jgi:hypothetical protein
MAIRTSEELKALFEEGDYPDQSAFGDLIDSCFNNSVSGNVVFNNDLTVNGEFYCDNIILSNQNGDQYRLIVTNSGELSAISFTP